MGLLDKAKETIKNALKEPSKEELIEVEYLISSANYYQDQIDNVMSALLPINNRYVMETYLEENMIVWKYDQCKTKQVKFENDSKNEHDSNAIKIIVKTGLIGNIHIGYIPQEDNMQFKKWLDERRIYNVNLIIYGGEKKIISKNNVVNDRTNYKVILNILIRK